MQTTSSSPTKAGEIFRRSQMIVPWSAVAFQVWWQGSQHTLRPWENCDTTSELSWFTRTRLKGFLGSWIPFLSRDRGSRGGNFSARHRSSSNAKLPVPKASMARRNRDFSPAFGCDKKEKNCGKLRALPLSLLCVLGASSRERSISNRTWPCLFSCSLSLSLSLRSAPSRGFCKWTEDCVPSTVQLALQSG